MALMLYYSDVDSCLHRPFSCDLYLDGRCVEGRGPLGTNLWIYLAHILQAIDLEAIEIGRIEKRNCFFNVNFYLFCFAEELSTSEVVHSPIIGNRNNATASPGAVSPVTHVSSTSTDPWPAQSDEDIDRLVAMHQNRSSLSSLGVREYLKLWLYCCIISKY